MVRRNANKRRKNVSSINRDYASILNRLLRATLVMLILMIFLTACITKYVNPAPSPRPVFLSQETINFIAKHNPPIAVKQNLSDIQAQADATATIREEEGSVEFDERGMTKYFVAAGAVVSGWWLGAKAFIGGFF